MAPGVFRHTTFSSLKNNPHKMQKHIMTVKLFRNFTTIPL